MSGLVLVRYIVKLGPLAAMPADAVAEAIAPTLQHYLTGPFPELPKT
jgi:hypothetical protein